MPRYTGRGSYDDDDYNDDDFSDDYEGNGKFANTKVWKSSNTIKASIANVSKKDSVSSQSSQAPTSKQSTPKTPCIQSSKPTPVTPIVSSISSGPTSQSWALKLTPSQQHVAKFISDAERSEEVVKGAIGVIKAAKTVSVLVVGHVDAGKSTIFGHLAVLTGSISTHDQSKMQALADSYNKSTFSYAFLLDTNDDERQRGLTIDVCNHTLTFAFPEQGDAFSEPHTVFLQDCPGHRDFVPSLIRAISQPDAAVIVIDASFQEFEKGLSEEGQTREHLQLLMIFGIKHLIVAVNKLDRTSWNEGRFIEIMSVLNKVLRKDIQFGGTVVFTPVSGIGADGEHNLTPDNAGKLPEWVRTYQSLGTELYNVKSIRSSSQVKGSKTSPTIILYDVVSDVCEGKKVFAATCVIESGILQCSDSIVHLPSMYIFQIASILSDGTEVDTAIAYDTVTLYLVPDKCSVRLCNNCAKMDANLVIKEMPQGSCFVLTGIVLQQGPVTKGVWINDMMLSSAVKALVLVLDTPYGLSVGDIYDCYVGSNRVEARIHKINAQIDPSTNEVIRKNPPIVGKSVYARIVLIFDMPIMIKQFAKSKLMGRVILRSNNKTVGLGKIESISENK